MLTTEPPVPPQPAGGERPSTAASEPATGFLATARTVVVTAALVAGGLLLAGYLVHAVVHSSHSPAAPTSQVGTSGNPPFPGFGGNGRPRFRGRRPDGFGVQPPGAFSPSDPSSGGTLLPGGPGGGFGPPDGGAPQDQTTPTTGRA